MSAAVQMGEDINGVGYAPPRPNRRGWDGLFWDRAEVAILASGESMNPEQAEAVRAWRGSRDEFDVGFETFPRRYVIAINTTWRLAPWADVLYACDRAWWEARERSDAPRYVDEAKIAFAGQLWTQDKGAAQAHGLRWIRSEPLKGLSRHVGTINQGANGGYQAIGLAYQAGAARCYLLGYDMKGGRWHGKHPGLVDRTNAFPVFLTHYAHLAREIKADKGIEFEVINCTPGSALKSFPMWDWREVFA